MQIDAINQHKDIMRIFYENQSQYIDDTDVRKIGVIDPRHEAHILNFMSTSSFISGYYHANKDTENQNKLYISFMGCCEPLVYDIAELSRQYIAMEIKFRTLIKSKDDQNQFNLKLILNGLKFSLLQLILIHLYVFVLDLVTNNSLTAAPRASSTLIFALLISAALMYFDYAKLKRRFVLHSGQPSPEFRPFKTFKSLYFDYCKSYISAAIMINLVWWLLLLITSYALSIDTENLMRGQHLGGQSWGEKLSSMIQYNLPSLIAYIGSVKELDPSIDHNE